jgi:enoyl-CoA hydratase
VYDALDDASVSVVASVDGQALAGGFEMVAACDLVVAGTEAAFGDQHVNVNLIPGGGNTQRLPRLIGRRRAKELMFTGDTIDSTTAQEWGLVNRVADGPASLTVGRELAGQIASKRAEAIQRMKELTNEGVEIPLGQALSLERDAAALHIASDAARDGLDRFVG